MNAGILPIILLFLAAALGLSFSSLRGAVAGAGATAAVALLMPSLVLGQQALEWVFVGLWVSTIMMVGGMCLLTRIPLGVATALGVNAGAWAGALSASTSLRAQTFIAVPILLLALPGRHLVQRGNGIALKVVGGWIAAIAILAIFVSLTPMPGYKPDHMQ